jgi:hypothetical protein
MSEMLYIVVEGQTEQTFVSQLLAPHLVNFDVICHAILLGKAGRKGGDVRFERAKSHIIRLLRQQSTTYISTMFDYFRIEPDWPGRVASTAIPSPQGKADQCEAAMVFALQQAIGGDNRVQQRFLPYIEMHEFEALLFSDPEQLAFGLGVEPSAIQAILDECGEPEAINDNPHTAPSKRIEALYAGRYRKTTTGISIAHTIGIATMRSHCSHFHQWVVRLENLGSLR